MPNTLREILQNKENEVTARKQQPRGREPALAFGTFLSSLSLPGTRIIAEIKPKSPSAGTLNSSVDLAAVTRSYSRHAAAISVLTDEKYFGGSMEALQKVSDCSVIPTLCKDFILDEIQVDDARNAGAEAVLLIVKALGQEKLEELHKKICSLNMVPVVEVQNEEELERALLLPPQCILINNRNLETFEIDLATTQRLAPKVSSGIKLISASGIEDRADIERLSRFTNCFLVGSSLMRAPSIEDKLRALSGHKMLVKTCGITSLADAEHALTCGADLLGLIFVGESPRTVSLEVAEQIFSKVGGERLVGVFKDLSVEGIEYIRSNVPFKFVQLHGNETAEQVQRLPGCIKAIPVAVREDVVQASRFTDAHFVLFDLPKGTSSVRIDDLITWINEVDPPIPFLLAGGLKPDSVRDSAGKVTARNFIGVDVASGIESEPGVKCAELLSKFIKEAKADAVAR